ncbi:MAG: GNAT family N-acetyltransferase [Oscillospiraceae bacterium]|nr:GNAT family N-acetyltransferase [Oscillospiraceae bacterium]
MNREMDITPAERELLTLLRMRPAAYLGNAVGLYSLAKFLDGYRVALIRHNLNDARILPEGFDDYAAKICTGQEAGARRLDSFLLEREPDGERALALFWDLLNAYLEENRCEPIPAPALPPAELTHGDGIDFAGFTDMPRLAESYMRTFNGAPWWDRWDKDTALRRLQDLFRSPGYYGLALWEENLPLGAVIGRTERYYDGDCFQIVEFWIEPRVQRSGCGRRLMEALRTELTKRGIAKIYLLTMQDASTQGFYEKNGFAMQEGMCVMQLC